MKVQAIDIDRRRGTGRAIEGALRAARAGGDIADAIALHLDELQGPCRSARSTGFSHDVVENARSF
jgi:hypothetical protein